MFEIFASDAAFPHRRIMHCFFFTQLDGAALLESFLFDSVLKGPNARRIRKKLDQIQTSMEHCVLSSEAIACFRDANSSLRALSSMLGGVGFKQWGALCDAARSWVAFCQTHKLTRDIAMRSDATGNLENAFYKMPDPGLIIKLAHSWQTVKDPDRFWDAESASEQDNEDWRVVFNHITCVSLMLPSGFKASSCNGLCKTQQWLLQDPGPVASDTDDASSDCSLFSDDLDAASPMHYDNDLEASSDDGIGE